MSSFKAKFPGKPVTRYFHGKRKEIQRIACRSGQDGTGTESKLNHPVTEYSLAATKIANCLKVFREEFGSSEESGAEFGGFDGDGGTVGEKLRTRYAQIQEEVDRLHTQMITLGGKPLPYQRPALPQPPKPIMDTLTQASGPSPVPTVKEIMNPSPTLARKTPKRKSAGRPVTTRTRPITPLSPLPLRLVPMKPSCYAIQSIPVVKYIQDIPLPLGPCSRSGKYVVEYEDESDDDDAENEDFTVAPKSERDEENDLGKTSVRLSNCPMDMDDVQEYGFPVIIDRGQGAVPPKPLCFRCGSAGIEQLIYCCSCCEPYHPFCSGDETLLSTYISRILPRKTGPRSRNDRSHPSEVAEDLGHLTLQAHAQIPIYYNREPDNLMTSLLSPPLTPMPLSTELDSLDKVKELELKNFLRTWTCSRCYVCYVCQSHSAPSSCQGQEVKFLKCPHCPRVVHSSCAGGYGKKVPSATSTRVCEECYKCKSCGKRMDRRGGRGKEETGQVLCLECFRKKQKGSFCPICEVCYEDDDYETKMMECARCQRWIHANCEKITGEEYEILSNLPETVEYICRECEDPTTVFWRQAIDLQFTSGCKEILRIFQTKATSTWGRKARILQPRCDNVAREVPKLGEDRVHLALPSQSSPSTKENKGIVRELFKATGTGTEVPRKPQGKLQNVSIVLEDITKVSESGKKPREIPSYSPPAAATTKKLSIVLHDIMKFPEPKETMDYESAVAMIVDPGSIVIPEANDDKTPPKSVSSPVPPPPKSPFDTPMKRINSITEIVLSSQPTSVKSIYSDTLQFISCLEEDYESSPKSLESHFVSALQEVFPWFNPEEIEVTGMETEVTGGSGLVTSVVAQPPPSDHSATSVLNDETLLRWNPFEDVYWDKTAVDMRRCSFCQELGDSPAGESGRLLWAGLSDWVHINCALWSSEVWEEEDGALQQVGVALSRSRTLSCEVCGKKGASVSCCFGSCRKAYHFPCALTSPCFLLEEDKGMFCPDHVGKAKGRRQGDMQILRHVYVDTDWLRKKDKNGWSHDLAVVLIGSCKIESLGHIVPLSLHKATGGDDGATTLVPLGYSVSRIFWSAELPSDPTIPRKVTYRVTTGVGRREARRSNCGRGRGQVREVNLRVDHSRSRAQVLRKLSQLKAFQDWAETSPTYVDEYGEEWLYPCTLQFLDSEEEGSDVDGDAEDNGDDAATTTTDDDLFMDCLSLAGDDSQRLSPCDLMELDLNPLTEEIDEELLTLMNGTMMEAKKLKLTLSPLKGEAGHEDMEEYKEVFMNMEPPMIEVGRGHGWGYEVVDSEAETEVDSDQDPSLEEETLEVIIPGAEDDECEVEVVDSEAETEVDSEATEVDSEETEVDSESETEVDSEATEVESESETEVDSEAEELDVMAHPTYDDETDEVMETDEDESDTWEETGEDEDIINEIEAVMLLALGGAKKTPGFIPQVDGGGGDDSDFYSSGSEGSTSVSSTSSGSDDSSSDGEEMVQETGNRKLPVRKARMVASKSSPAATSSKKSPKKSGGGQRSSPAAGKISTVAFGGRMLRNRKKLKEVKRESKKEEPKCPVCKKSFSSQTSVNRHSKWCKPKKGGGGKEEKRPRKEKPATTAAVGPKSKRGRKPKKVVEPAPVADNKDSNSAPSPPQRLRAQNSPKPSTSGRNLEEVDTKTRGGTKKKGGVTVPEFLERDTAAVSGFDVRPDGKVYCRRCKNTYRTSFSYDNHVRSCHYFSSEEEEEASLEDVALENPGNVQPCPSPVPSDSTTDSESETFSPFSEERPPSPCMFVCGQPSSPLVPSGATSGTIPPVTPEPQIPVSSAPVTPVPVDGQEGYLTIQEPSDTGNLLEDQTLQHFQVYTEPNFPENDVGNEELTNEIQVMEEEIEAAKENSIDETPEPQFLEAMEEGEEEVTGEEYAEQGQLFPAQFTTATAASQLIPDQIPYTLPPQPQPPPLPSQFQNLPPPLEWMNPVQGQQPMPTVAGAIQEAQGVCLQQSQQHVTKAPLPAPHPLHQHPPSFHPMLQNQHFQTFQGVQQEQYSHQPHFPQQIHQSASLVQHQAHAQQQQFQTLTFQDPSGQLLTFQVPVVQQPPSSTFVQQPDAFYGQVPFQPSEVQYEQYKQQIQAAIQLQRNTLQGHHHPLQQQPLYHPLQQDQQHSSIQHQLVQHSSQAPSNGNPPMLMSVNPHLFSSQHHHHHQHQQHHPASSIHVPGHVPQASSDGMTYMVVQQGTSVSQSHCQHPLLPTNPEPLGLRPAQAQASPLIFNPHQQPGALGVSRVCLSGPSARPCPCADCVRKSPSSTGEKQRPYWLKKGSGGATGGANPRKPKVSTKIRDRLAIMMAEGEGTLESTARLQLFKSMTTPTTTLPKLLPATATVTPSTSTLGGFKTPEIMSPSMSLSLQRPPTTSGLTTATTLTSDSLMAPIVSASAAPPQLLKAPTPSPNIAVVRPMEHPLQKLSNQIQQLESSLSSPMNSVQGSLDNITGRPECPVVLPPPPAFPAQMSTGIPALALGASLAENASGLEGVGVLGEPGKLQLPDEGKEILKSSAAPIQQEQQPVAAPEPPEDKSIKIQLKRQEGGDSYSINKISGSATSNKQFQGMFKTLKIKGKITTGDQAGTSTDVVVHPIVHTIPIPSPDGGDDGESNRTIVEDDQLENPGRTSLEASVKLPLPSSFDDEGDPPRKKTTLRLTHRAVIVYQVKIDDKVQYQSCDVRAVWGYILERVQGTRRNHNLPPLAYPATNISLPENKQEAAAAASFNRLGLTHRAVQFLLEQLPGVKNAAKEGHVFKFHEPPKTSVEDAPIVENPTGSARSEVYKGRKPFDMFGWLASKHRQPPELPEASTRNSDMIKGGNLPIAMKYRNLFKNGTKHLKVFYSSIHGRGLFTTRHIEAGDLIIEYAGEVIRSQVCEMREKYYESKGIGCYMFRIDEHSVVDATLKGNASRFINHSCDPNCRSSMMNILGTKRILIFALGRIVAGEELTYDYKFEFEEGVRKLPCSCGTKKCRKFLN